MFFHPLRHSEVLGAVVTSDTAGYTVLAGGSKEQLQDGMRAVVGMDASASDLAGGAVDERVIDELPPDETWNEVES